MVRSYITSAVAGAFLLGLTTAALAVTGEYGNMCTMGLASGKDIQTDCSINSQIQGKTYCLQGGHDPIHGGPVRQSRQGAGLLFKEASRLSFGLR